MVVPNDDSEGNEDEDLDFDDLEEEVDDEGRPLPQILQDIKKVSRGHKPKIEEVKPSDSE